MVPLCSSILGSALAQITARPIRAIGADEVAFGAEMVTTMAPGVETANFYSEIGTRGNKYGGYAL